MSDISFNGVPFQEAIEHIRQKVKVPTERWDQLMGEAHSKAFTVAGAVKTDLLKDLHSDITNAIENGESIGQFRSRFDETVKKHGWSFNGDYGWRTRTIYDTNMRTAHMAGRWKQFERNKVKRPYLIYMTVGDERVRWEHSTWHKLALKVDDPFWSTHYPPNGWGCRCYVIQATEKQVNKLGAEIAENPGIEKSERVNTTTGEIYGEVPIGIDTGWDYNVGKAWLGPDISFGQKLQQLPPALKKPALEDINTEAITKSWQSWLKQVDAAPHAKGHAHTVGYLPNQVIESLSAKEILPKSAAVIIYDSQLPHLRGEHKGKSRSIPEAWLQQLPVHLRNYQAVLIHKQTGNVVFVLPGDAGGKKGRAVIEINFKKKGQFMNSVRSLGIVDIKNLRQKDYELLEGELK
ncbi:MAG: minor capsid protein [Neptuniibacter sp.]